MIYKILKKASTSEYWQFVVDSNNVEFETTDLVVLESKLKELSSTTPTNQLKVVSELVFDNDFIFATI